MKVAYIIPGGTLSLTFGVDIFGKKILGSKASTFEAEGIWEPHLFHWLRILAIGDKS
jgi:hypothetical protein